MTKKLQRPAREEELSVFDRLTRLGLTENDAKVYVHMLERGVPLGGSKIASWLGLHRQYVHNSLHKLIALELVEEMPVGARKKYQALSPQYLTLLAKKQLESAQKAARELDKISAVGAEQDFEVYRGAQQIFAFEEDIVHNLQQNETQYIIGGGADAFISFYGNRYEELSSVAQQRGLRTLYVGSPHEVPWLKRAQAVFGKRFDYRILKELPKTIVQTVIRFDTVTFYSFGNPPLVYIIKSKAVAGDYKKFFDMHWHLAGQEESHTSFA